MPARVLYAGQEVKITSSNSGIYRYLPVQSANCEVSRPIEDILSFGQLGSLGRFQTAVSTCKADIKTYIANTTGLNNNLLNTAFISQLTGDALAGSVATIGVTPNGFQMSGILSSFGVEIANGGFATADLSFAGVGEPVFAPAPAGSSFSTQANMPASFTPVLSANVGGNITGGCPNSFKFSLDMPNDTISCLGIQVSGSQSEVAPGFLMVAKSPFKTSVSVEGTAVDLPSNPQGQFVVGKLGITLPAAQVTSHSFNNAVGNVGATYNYTLEDVTVVFADIP